MAILSPPLGLAQPGDNIEQKIRQARTPADHQSLAVLYEKEAQTAYQLAAKYLPMRDVYAAACAGERKDRAGEPWVFIAKKYQEIAKKDEILAAMDKTMAAQLK